MSIFCRYHLGCVLLVPCLIGGATTGAEANTFRRWLRHLGSTSTLVASIATTAVAEEPTHRLHGGEMTALGHVEASLFAPSVHKNGGRIAVFAQGSSEVALQSRVAASTLARSLGWEPKEPQSPRDFLEESPFVRMLGDGQVELTGFALGPPLVFVPVPLFFPGFVMMSVDRLSPVPVCVLRNHVRLRLEAPPRGSHLMTLDRDTVRDLGITWRAPTLAERATITSTVARLQTKQLSAHADAQLIRNIAFDSWYPKSAKHLTISIAESACGGDEAEPEVPVLPEPRDPLLSPPPPAGEVEVAENTLQ